MSNLLSDAFVIAIFAIPVLQAITALIQLATLKKISQIIQTEH